MPARKSTLSADALRDALLDAAGRLLTDEGPHALSTRRLTEAVGTSTQSIYTLFGGKEGLIRAMYREGFTRLSARMLDVPTTDDVLADLRGLGYAYRAAAHAGPHFYAVMFGHPVAEFTPDADDRLYALATHQLLADAVQPGGAGGHDREVRALEAKAHRHMTRDHVDDGGGHKKGRDAPRPAVGEFGVGVFDEGQAPDARADDATDALGLVCGECITRGQACIGHGLRGGHDATEKELREHVAHEIGAIAKPKAIYVTPDLPKTRSGKIMRRLLRDVAEGRNLGDTTTLADANVVNELQRRATEAPSED